MKTLRAMMVRFGGLFRRRQQEDEMNEELRAHLDELIERNIAAGMSADEARYAASRSFGGVEQVKERARASLRFIWLENLLRDVSFALRTLRKKPGFTSVVVLTLALGLGVNMALFTWFNAAAFRPLPVLDPGQLFKILRLENKRSEPSGMSYPDFVTYRQHQTVFAGLAISMGWNTEFVDAPETTISGEMPAGLRLEMVSANYFSVFGVPIGLGRPLVEADEDGARAQPVIVLSHRFWQNHLGGDPNVIGRTLRLRGLSPEALTIVGVTSPEFFGTRPGSPAGWVPFLLRPDGPWRSDLKAANTTLTGRLREGVSREQAAEQLQTIANQFLTRSTGVRAAETIILTKASTYITLTTHHLAVLLPMICLFGVVFVVSCANASNLLLARMVTRQFEFAVRSALGATRGRMFTLIMAESLVLGVLGGVLGWAVAAGLLQLALPWLLDMLPGAREGSEGLYLNADYRVFAFTLVVSVLAGVAGGLLPALHVTRRNVVSGLNREGSAFGRKLRLSRVRNFLAVAQLALSAALLFTAGLLVHRALSVQLRDVGFDQSRLVTLEVLAPRSQATAELDAGRRQVLERLRTLPGVTAISEMPQFPFEARMTQASVAASGRTDRRTLAMIHTTVPASYFTTVQLPLARGRSFLAHEGPSDGIAMISETAARELWPNGDALGQRFDLPTGHLSGAALRKEALNDPDTPRTSLTVIGIVRDTRIYDPLAGDPPLVYLPAPAAARAAPYLLIRTTHNAKRELGVLQQVGREVTGLAPRVLTASEQFDRAFIQHRIIAWAAGMLAGISLIVAVLGLYGVMSFAVNQRVKEIGIRIALGASPGRVASGVVIESLRLVAAGTSLGYGLSVGIAQVGRKLLFGVSAFNPVAGGAVALFLAAIGVLACWMPARRASKVDPVVALRAE